MRETALANGAAGMTLDEINGKGRNLVLFSNYHYICIMIGKTRY